MTTAKSKTEKTTVRCPVCSHKMTVHRDPIAGDFYVQCRNKDCWFDGVYGDTVQYVVSQIVKC